MARHEVAVRANIAFHTRQPPFDVFQTTPEQVVIAFEGRDFVWHPNLEPGPLGEEWWPGVTVVVANRDNYEEERELMHRFLSALSYELGEPIEVLSGGGTGVAEPLAPPVPHAMRRGFGDQIRDAPAAIEVTDDERLRLVLALYREGKNSESPFYKFLSFWNALDATFDNDPPSSNSLTRRRAGAPGLSTTTPRRRTGTSTYTTQTETPSPTRYVTTQASLFSTRTFLTTARDFTVTASYSNACYEPPSNRDGLAPSVAGARHRARIRVLEAGLN